MVFSADSYLKVFAVLFPFALVYCCVKLIGPILFPTVISYPWPGPSLWGKNDKNLTVVLAGSFNPPHKGHLAMIQYLSLRYVFCSSSSRQQTACRNARRFCLVQISRLYTCL